MKHSNRYSKIHKHSVLSAIFAACVVCIEPLYSENTERSILSEKPMMTPLKGVLLIPHQDYVRYTDMRQVEGLCARDLDVPGGIACLAEVLEPIFMGQAVTKNLLQRLKEEIIIYYRDYNHPVVAVYVPEQEITEGVLQLVVVEACVGQVACSGNCWFSSWLYQHSLPLKPGDRIATDALLTYVSWLNRNPFRNVDIVFTPGCDPGTTNIEFVVCDRCPFQVYAGADNTGNDDTDNIRLFAGATWGNAFWLDHILNYQYTASPDFKTFQSHSVHYTAPIFYRNLLILYGGYATVHPKDTDLTSSGHIAQASIRDTTPFSTYCNSMHEFTIGFDWKNFDTNLFFVGETTLPLITSTINLSQFMIGYAYGIEDDLGTFSFNLDLYGSPGKLLPNESDSLYNEISANASVQYLYGRLTMGKTWCLIWDCTLSALVRGQAAIGPLLPSERFGVGGYDTVRGYLEREFNADDAFIGNAELRTPGFSLLSQWDICEPCDEMLFLTFFDYGYGHVSDPALNISLATLDPNGVGNDALMSVGIGWRYRIGRYFSARLDWGIKLREGKFSDSARSKFHGGVVISY